MPAAVSTALKSSIAIAGASIIAVSPLIPTQNVHVPTVNLPAIELSAAADPCHRRHSLPDRREHDRQPAGAGSGPVRRHQAVRKLPRARRKPLASFPAVPFTGWGALGIGAGLISSPIVFFGALGDGSVSQALGAALLAIQVPIRTP